MKQSPEWYASDEATRIAENVLLFQRNNGGWPKNIDMATVLVRSAQQKLAREKKLEDTTIDNGATHTQLVYLARVISANNDSSYKQRFVSSFEQGLDFVFSSQYENGGFPQFYPLRKGYYSHITYNDGAMIGVLKLLRDIAEQKREFAFVDDQRRRLAAEAVQRGIDCILKSQVLVGGKRTVWAAQHDEVTLAPAAARTFEPVALSGGESVEITRFLMDIKSPATNVMKAIESAVAWFERSKLSGIKWIEKADSARSARLDRVVVNDTAAGPLWARFYEIETNRPIFAGRDGVVKYSVAEIDAERRNGYQWYVNAAERLLNKDYPQWQRRVARQN